MSRTWAKGSDRAWRRLRLYVLNRDRWQCQLKLDGCTGREPWSLLAAPYKAHVHHTHGRAVTGDDPAHLVAACAHCNLKTGDPTRQPDPPPRPRTRW